MLQPGKHSTICYKQQHKEEGKEREKKNKKKTSESDIDDPLLTEIQEVNDTITNEEADKQIRPNLI